MRSGGKRLIYIMNSLIEGVGGRSTLLSFERYELFASALYFVLTI